VAGTAHGRVRACSTSTASRCRTPSRPSGAGPRLTSVPRAGDTFLVAPDDRTARQIAAKRRPPSGPRPWRSAASASRSSRSTRPSSRARSRPSTSS
jgi:hypothetical protein